MPPTTTKTRRFRVGNKVVKREFQTLRPVEEADVDAEETVVEPPVGVQVTDSVIDLRNSPGTSLIGDVLNDSDEAFDDGSSDDGDESE